VPELVDTIRADLAAAGDRAKSDPDWVRAFVAAHVDRLSPLSRREATKHL